MRIGECHNEKDLVVALETARTERLEKRRGFETTWWNNIALVAGDHYARWNPTLSRFEDRDPAWSSLNTEMKPRLVINHALTVARTELSKLTKARPVMDIVARSDEAVDISATKVGLAALDFAEWNFQLAKMRRDAIWWMIQCGVSSICVGWDPLTDKPGVVDYVIDPTTGEPTFNDLRKSELQDLVDQGIIDELQTESFPLGDLDYKIYTAFQLFPDPNASDFTQLNDLITSDVINVDVVRGVYGKRADKIKPDSNLALGTIETRMMQRAGVPGGTGGATQQTVDDSVQVNTFWLPPNVYRGNRFLERGVMMRWCGAQEVLDFNPTFPLSDGRIPHVFFQHIPTASSIWPDTVLTHIRGPNLEIDKTVSQLIENKDYMGNPMWLVATQHKVKGEIKNVAGSIVRYRHVPNIPPPAPVPGIQMPAQVENLIVGLRDQILDISGQSEVSRGRMPTGVRSGVQASMAQEEDDTKIQPTVTTMEEAIGLMGSMTLSRMGQYYSFERILRFYRRDGSFDVRKFKGADLKGNTDVVCQAGSMMPRMKAAKQQFVLELATLGIKTDPKWLEEALEIGEGEPDLNDKSIAQADRENSMMLYGVWRAQTNDEPEGAEVNDEARFQKLKTAIPVKAWHNHQLHVERHTSRMMDQDFDDLAISRPEVVRLFDEHIAMHMQEMAKQAQEQAMALQAAKGAPDGPPTPPGGEAMGTNMTEMDVPIPTGGGAIEASARQIRPQ